MTKSYNKISNFKEKLMNDLRDSMEDGVSLAVKFKMHDAIKTKVYDEYMFPKRYERRKYDDGGLLSDDAFWHDTKRDGNTVRFVAENRAKANPQYDDIEGSSSQYLAPLIVYGHGGAGGKYSWGDAYPYSYIKPRDFMGETRRLLMYDKMHKTSLWIALEDKGYKTSIY